MAIDGAADTEIIIEDEREGADHLGGPRERVGAADPGGGPSDGDVEGAAGGEEVEATPTTYGTIAIYSDPSVDVFVDGHYIGKTPIRRHELATGKHEFEFFHVGMGWSRKQKVSISAGPNREIQLSPRPL